MKLGVIVPIRDEAQWLPRFLRSLAEQDLLPHQLVLVDDGSSDESGVLASAFTATRSYAETLTVPPHPPVSGAMAPAIRTFTHGTRAIRRDLDVIGKLDADLELPPDFLATIARALQGDPRLGIVGTHLSEEHDRGLERMRCPEGHVHGATKFYRASCYAQVAPLPPIMGWDTIDELRAELLGWTTRSIAVPSRDPVHLRRMGSRAGLLRGYRLAGSAAWGYGSSPLGVAVGAASRARDRPLVLCGLHYLGGWLSAGTRGAPRAEPAVRALARRRLRRRLVRD